MLDPHHVRPSGKKENERVETSLGNGSIVQDIDRHSYYTMLQGSNGRERVRGGSRRTSAHFLFLFFTGYWSLVSAAVRPFEDDGEDDDGADDDDDDDDMDRSSSLPSSSASPVLIPPVALSEPPPLLCPSSSLASPAPAPVSPVDVIVVVVVVAMVSSGGTSEE